MSPLGGLRVLVAGAGALGSAIAWRLQTAGASVVLADPVPLGDNASGVAAGMLAPVFETALDPASAGHLALYMAARDLWPAFAGAIGGDDAGIDRAGALWVADEASIEEMQARLGELGTRARRLTAREAEALSPGLEAPDGALHVAEDWRASPRPMLQALHRAFTGAGGRFKSAALQAIGEGRVRLGGGETPAVDHVVLASGMPPQALEDPPAELAVLQPIKGQIALAAGAGPRAGPVVRSPGVYVVPGPDGAMAGATMEVGRDDRRLDPAALARLRELAGALFPDMRQAPMRGQAGVRASTPDALPLVGPASRPGVSLALGARRNGWLLAPLLAEIVLAELAGRPQGPWAAALDPLRSFSRSG